MTSGCAAGRPRISRRLEGHAMRNHPTRTRLEQAPAETSSIRSGDQGSCTPWLPTGPGVSLSAHRGNMLGSRLVMPPSIACQALDDFGVAGAGSQPVQPDAPVAVKRRHPRSARPDRQIARHSGRLGVPRLGSRAGEVAAPPGRWSAPAVRCSTGHKAGRGGGRPPTRPPGRAGPGRCRGYGRRRGRILSGCGRPGRGAGAARPGVRPARME